MRGLAKCVLGLALLTSSIGCSGGDAGPRDSVTAPNGGTGSTGGPIVVDPPSMRTVVYVPSWNSRLSAWVGSLDFTNVTHVNLSFAEVDVGGNVRYPDTALPSFIDRAHQY